MKTVWKYPIPIEDHFTLEMPLAAKVLTVQLQDDPSGLSSLAPYLWALVDPANVDAMRTRRFRLAGTGHPIEDTDGLKYIATFQMLSGRLVWHVFEENGA
jgi:hypothetical protein